MPKPLLSCIVVDDEPPSIALLEDYIKNTPSLQFQESFTNPLEALARLGQNEVDLVFLDISMPELNGLDFARMVKGKTMVILCTAYPEYGAESYAHDVTDYLLKPIEYVRFLGAVQKALGTVRQKAEPTGGATDFIMVTGTGRYNKIKINFSDILYISSLKNNITFHLVNEAKVALLTLKEAEAMLPANRFVRVHLSYIVCIDKILRLDNASIKLMQCNDTIPIGPAYRKGLMDALNMGNQN
jgi:two-component system, LytTR family, response regulator